VRPKTVKYFATEVERQFNTTILKIRSDNGTEFKNYSLNEFLSGAGIKHQYSTSYTPQQNGVAETKNQTLMDAARTILVEFKSPYNFWAKAINTACRATNWLYLRKNLNKTPYEILIGQRPNIKYVRVFGCKCFYPKKGVHLSKFDTKALEGIFVGYSSDSHSYRIYSKSTGHVIETCNVRLDEDNGSFVGKSGVRDVGDEISPKAIRRMGVRFFCHIEGQLLVEGEGQCSIQVEPSPAEHPQELNQRQVAHPRHEDHSIEQSCPEFPTPKVRSLRHILESLGQDTGVSGVD
jgi:hypothetical protein